MSTTSDPDRARPRASRGQVVTAGAAIVTAVAAIVAAAAVVWLAAFQTVVLKSLGETGTGFDQGVKELVCVPYANAVLDLSKQGYSANAIADVYRNAAKPAAGEAPRDPGTPKSWAIDYCGSPALVLAAAKTKTK